jgi:hypothetical protein
MLFLLSKYYHQHHHADDYDGQSMEREPTADGLVSRHN